MTETNTLYPFSTADDSLDAARTTYPHYHVRTSSTTSNATLPENTFDLMPPTEPLLRAPESEAPVLLQPVQPTGYESYRLRASTERLPHRGQCSLWETIVRKRLRLLKTLKYSLEALIAVWAVFNSIRYLYSYSKYASSEGQAASLVLAISTSLSLAFLTCAALLSKFRVSLARSTPPRASHIIRKVLRSIATCLILAPAILNVIFLCIWRRSANRELTYRYRCYVDIDIIWSASDGHCIGPPWGVWLILALLRLAITIVVLASYHVFSFAYGRTLRLSKAKRIQSLGIYETAEASPVTRSSMKETSHEQHFQAQHRPSHSTISSNVESTRTVVQYQTATPKSRLGHAGSFVSSDDEHSPNTIRLPNDPNLGPEESTDSWSDSLSEHFRTLISRISQEMDDVVHIARFSDEEDNTDDNHSPTLHPESPYSFNLPPVPPTVGYNEFGQPYPPEEPLPILNGFVRRMPTIESMGSREMGSIGSSMCTTNKEPKVPGSARSTLTFDRPPTRTLSRSEFTNSGTSSSRPNSFGARAELFASLSGNGGAVPTATEMGELFDNGPRCREDEAKRTPSPTVLFDMAQNSSASRSTTSYYTATSGSLGSAVDGVS